MSGRGGTAGGVLVARLWNTHAAAPPLQPPGCSALPRPAAAPQGQASSWMSLYSELFKISPTAAAASGTGLEDCTGLC